MQLNLFEDINIKQEGIEYVAEMIIKCDSIRGFIKQAIINNDKKELVKLFNESIRTFGFSGPNMWSWGMGTLETPDRTQKFKVTAEELADAAIKLEVTSCT